MNVLHNPILSGHNAQWDTPSGGAASDQAAQPRINANARQLILRVDSRPLAVQNLI